jgi:UDP-N-acetylmuramyl pentapeptide phosphotransferase/UDP-N-acetylglucosamine-1-phosphate transferase
MIAAVAFAIGAMTGALLWAAMAPQLAASDALERENYRGHRLPVAAGMVIVLAHVLLMAAYTAWVELGGVSDDEAGRGVAVVWAGSIAFGLLGLFDDLAGTPATRGFRGHLGAARRGELTTGMVKLLWGGLLGFVLAPGGLGDSIRGGLVIAAAANAANLFDRAPGRVIKVSVLGAVVVALLGAPGWDLTAPMVIVGAGVGLLAADLRERCMIGDTGSNVLGAAIGYGVLLATGPTGEWIALAVLVAINLASERVSFSRVIDAAAPLRWFDRLGALPERRSWGAHGQHPRAAEGQR